MRWPFLLVLIFIGIMFLRGVYLEMLRDPTMAWLTRLFTRRQTHDEEASGDR